MSGTAEGSVRRVYVRLQPSGTRLGNWMFQYAAAKTAEPEAEIVFFIENRDEWRDVERRRDVFGDVPIVDSVPEGAVVRTALYQDAAFVDAAVVSRLYRCPEAIEASLRAKYGDLLEDPDLCSVHVRRGDYLGLPHRHPFVGEKYLEKAVRLVSSEEGTKTFAVCSDDLPWCRGFFTPARFPGLTFHFIDGGSVIGDLFFMTFCRHHVCSNSTFSWWGAFIGRSRREGRTVFPSMWYGPAIRGESWQGLYFAGSTVIRNGYTFGRWFHARAMMFKNFCGDLLRTLGLRSSNRG